MRHIAAICDEGASGALAQPSPKLLTTTTGQHLIGRVANATSCITAEPHPIVITACAVHVSVPDLPDNTIAFSVVLQGPAFFSASLHSFSSRFLWCFQVRPQQGLCQHHKSLLDKTTNCQLLRQRSKEGLLLRPEGTNSFCSS